MNSISERKYFRDKYYNNYKHEEKYNLPDFVQKIWQPFQKGRRVSTRNSERSSRSCPY